MKRIGIVVAMVVAAFVFGHLSAPARAQTSLPQVFMLETEGRPHVAAYYAGMGKIFVYTSEGACWKVLTLPADAASPIKNEPCKQEQR